ncbi:MAG TPA: response regulator [Caldithrix abyssi]|uniref:histidine kinase n=1 Tax=Caldithrix abyssi TaxID=187145 RepID=A0A7V4WW85_CALAY|nr:response regulator [Caldithrix abyssi]
MTGQTTKINLLYYFHSSLSEQDVEAVLKKSGATVQTIRFNRISELIFPSDFSTIDAVIIHIDTVTMPIVQNIEDQTATKNGIFYILYNSIEPFILWKYSGHPNLILLPLSPDYPVHLDLLFKRLKEQKSSRAPKALASYYFKQTYGNYPIPLIILSTKGKILYTNQAFDKRFFYAHSQAGKVQIRDILPGINIQDILRRGSNKKEKIEHSLSSTITDGKGNLLPCKTHIVFKEKEGTEYILLFVEDLAELQQKQRQLGEQDISFHLISQITDLLSETQEIGTENSILLEKLQKLFHANHVILLPMNPDEQTPDLSSLRKNNLKLLEPIREKISIGLATQKPSCHQMDDEIADTYTTVFLIPLLSNKNKLGIIVLFYLNRFEPTVLQLEAAEMISRLIGGSIFKTIYLRKLRASDSLFKTAAENAMNGIYQATPDGRLVFANPALQKMLGYNSFEEMQSLNLANDIYLNPQDKIRFKKELEKNKVIHNSTVKLKKKDGTTIIALENAFIEYDENGNPFYQGTLKNITGYEELQRRLKEAGRLSLDFLDKSGFAVAAFDSEGILRIWNRVVASLSGFSRAEIGEKEAFLNLLNHNMTGVVDTESSYGLRKLTIETKNQEHIILAWDVENLNLPDYGELEVWIGFPAYDDLTERSSEASGTIEPTRQTDILTGFVEKFIKSVHHQAIPPKEMQALFSDYRKKLENIHKLPLINHYTDKVVNAAEIGEHTFTILKDLIPSKINFTVNLKFAGLLQTQKTTLESIFKQLLLNAIESIDENGSIEFSSRLISDRDNLPSGIVKNQIEVPCAVFSIKDTGCGILPGELDKIFFPFYTTKDPLKHPGLGLTLCKTLVSAMRGHIHIDSYLGKGTTVSLLLPVEEKNAGKSSSHGAKSTEKNTVLVVDDENVIRELIQDVLIMKNINVILASDGLEGYEKYLKHKNDIGLVILDIIMPGMDGKELYFKIKEDNPDMRVIVTSGYSKTNIKEELLQAGVEHFLAKPFNINDLSRILDTIFPSVK